MVKNLKVDWRAKLEKLPQWRDIYHLVVLPMYQEEKEIVESSLQSLKEADYPKEKMIVVLTVEERGGEKAKEVAEVMFQLLVEVALATIVQPPLLLLKVTILKGEEPGLIVLPVVPASKVTVPEVALKIPEELSQLPPTNKVPAVEVTVPWVIVKLLLTS